MAGPPRPAVKSRGRGRLSRAAEFERVYRQGRSHANRFLVLHAFPRSAGAAGAPVLDADTVDGARLGLSVSRKVGGAVERNLVKRLLREAFALDGAVVASDLDLVVVARPAVGELAEREGLAGVRAALAELLTKIGGQPA